MESATVTKKVPLPINVLLACSSVTDDSKQFPKSAAWCEEVERFEASLAEEAAQTKEKHDGAVEVEQKSHTAGHVDAPKPLHMRGNSVQNLEGNSPNPPRKTAVDTRASGSRNPPRSTAVHYDDDSDGDGDEWIDTRFNRLLREEISRFEAGVGRSIYVTGRRSDGRPGFIEVQYDDGREGPEGPCRWYRSRRSDSDRVTYAEAVGGLNLSRGRFRGRRPTRRR